MKKLFNGIIDSMANGHDVVLMTIIASSGSTPRGSGARMMVTESESIGTVGGGAIEHRATLMAREILVTKESRAEAFVLNRQDVSDLGMICGGDVVVYFQYIAHNDEQFMATCRNLIDCINNDVNTWMIMHITDYGVSSVGYYTTTDSLVGIDEPLLLDSMTSKAHQVELNGRKYYVEKIVSSGKVYVFGGGHIAQSLVPILSNCNFNVVVVEDRQDFCTKQLFPTASGLVLVDCLDVLSSINFTANDYACIMTRGHSHDYDLQKMLLSTDLKYIGVMGSIAKMKGIAERFVSEGFEASVINRFKSPIGLAIKGETPAEIAVSIAAEIILERANRYEQEQ